MHPNLIKYYGAAIRGKEVNIVTEYMVGGGMSNPGTEEALLLLEVLTRPRFLLACWHPIWRLKVLPLLLWAAYLASYCFLC